MFNAGFDITSAMENINQELLDLSLQPVITQLKRGVTLSRALAHSKIITAYETTLLEVAEYSGKLSDALNTIAELHENRQLRISKLKTQLSLPIFVVLVGVIAGVMLNITQGNSVLTSLFDHGVLLIIVFVVTKCLISLLKSDIFSLLSKGWNLGLQKSTTFFQRYFEFYFYTLLIWQVSAGVDYQLALRKNARILSAKDYQIKLRNAQSQVQQGEDIAKTLQENGLILSSDLGQAIRTGQHSGSFEQAIEHHLAQQEIVIERTTNMFFEWLPRFYYLLVLILVLPRFL